MSGTDPLSPQFETVEYAPTAGGCVLCNEPIKGTYYRVNGEMACSQCVERERSAQGNANKYYPRSLMYGIGAAVVGMIGYATFEIATGWIIGYVSLAVGWLVGKAMLKGSNGFGGRKYQITAVVLTYAAVSLAAVPVMIHQLSKEKPVPAPNASQQLVAPPPTPQTDQQTNSGASDSQPSVTVTPDSNKTEPVTSEAEPKEKPKMGIGKALGLLALIGLASPFLELSSPLHGIIGLVILFVGMQIAWKMTARPKLLIDGPF